MLHVMLQGNIDNEEKMVEKLKDYLKLIRQEKRLELEVIDDAGKLSYEELALQLASARIVIAVHGGALSNLIFMAVDTNSTISNCPFHLLAMTTMHTWHDMQVVGQYSTSPRNCLLLWTCPTLSWKTYKNGCLLICLHSWNSWASASLEELLLWRLPGLIRSQDRGQNLQFCEWYSCPHLGRWVPQAYHAIAFHCFHCAFDLFGVPFWRRVRSQLRV